MSSGIIKGCILRSRNYKYRDVNLPDKILIIVGRGPQTKIRERRCSKQQVQITADYSLEKAEIQQLGHNSSEVDGTILHSQEKITVEHGANINLLKDELQYTLEFIGKGKLASSTFGPKEQSIYEAANLDTKQDSKSNNCPAFKKAEKLKREDDHEGVQTKKQKQDSGEFTASEAHRKDIAAKLAAMRDSLAENLTLVSNEDKWEEYDHSKLLIFTPAGLNGKPKIAAFDLDHTVICTKSGKVFPISIDDWRIMYPDIPGKLKKLHAEGYKIVIFTNQKGISKGKTPVSEFKKKINSIVKRLGLPIQVMVSTGSGKYRKPNTGMWDYFIERKNDGVMVDLNSCIYVGDAAGRLENWAPKKKKDFSCADRLFAMNANLKFHTPEEFFLDQRPAAFRMPNFDPRCLKAGPLAIRYTQSSNQNVEVDEKSIVSPSSEVIVFVGFPASGKTHFAENYLLPKGYIHVNRDTLGSWQKCLVECSKALEKGKQVVIDNTNPDVESRIRYIECAKKFKVPCRCFLFDCSLEQAKHNNMFRELTGTDKKHVGVNDMVLNSYKSKYVEPSLKEGFTEILKINFIPKFKNRHEEKLFKRFLIEK